VPRTLSLWHSMITAVAAAVLATAVATPASAAPNRRAVQKKLAAPAKKIVVHGSGAGSSLLNWTMFASLRP
jgi:ABC-type spermidine/putrescine transport system permease subunit II